MRQRLYECLLASACAATGKDYLTESNRYRDIHGVSWYDNQLDDELMRSRWAAFLIEYISPLFATAVRFLPVGAPLPTTTSLQGRGIIIFVNQSETAAHACSYHDGRVHDPINDATYESLEVFLRLPWYRGWSLSRVIPLSQEGA